MQDHTGGVDHRLHRPRQVVLLLPANVVDNHLQHRCRVAQDIIHDQHAFHDLRPAMLDRVANPGGQSTLGVPLTKIADGIAAHHFVDRRQVA